VNRLEFIQKELTSRKVTLSTVPQPPKVEAKAPAKAKTAAAPAKMLLTPTPVAPTGPVDDGKHQFVLAPAPIVQAELKELPVDKVLHFLSFCS
jgi:hypothetical protein